QKMCITTYRKKLIEALTQKKDEQINTRTEPRHHLEKKEGSAHEVRRYCTECYDTNSQMLGSKMAKNLMQKVTTFCN
ncbi:unnamed protein product, partial [Heterotrigona itama]